tara:strand:+ start:168 stop:494 length:327 start_codon:yes stop_codon:yes gene_type:complete
MIDVRDDKKQAEDWLDNGNGEMDADTLNFIAINGFEDCGRKPCFSAKACGSDACFCVRATFPSREHYQLYLALRERYLMWLKLGLIGAATSGTKETTNEKNDNAIRRD